MAEYMTLEDFLAKVSWEGGVFEALEYGLHHTHLDPNDTGSIEVRTIWQELENIHRGMADRIKAIDEIMEEMDTPS